MRFFRQTSASFRALLVVLATLVSMAVLVAAADRSGLTVDEALADPYEHTNERLLGIVAIFGVLLWSVGTWICLFTAWVLEPESDGSSRWRWLFLVAGLVSLMFLLDDLLAIHEFADDVVARFVDIDQTRTQKDLIESGVFAVYGVCLLGYLFWFKDLLRTGGLVVLGAALFLFGGSILLDVAIQLPGQDESSELQMLVEDGFKLTGIALFALFHADLARRRLRDRGSAVAPSR